MISENIIRKIFCRFFSIQSKNRILTEVCTQLYVLCALEITYWVGNRHWSTLLKIDWIFALQFFWLTWRIGFRTKSVLLIFSVWFVRDRWEHLFASFLIKVASFIDIHIYFKTLQILGLPRALQNIIEIIFYCQVCAIKFLFVLLSVLSILTYLTYLNIYFSY